jgi:hypothetical protein
MTTPEEFCARCGLHAFAWNNCPATTGGGHVTTDELRVLKRREKAALRETRTAATSKHRAGRWTSSPFDILRKRSDL